MKIVALLILLSLTWIGAFGQNLIGYKGKEIKNYMTKNHRDMSYNSVTNNKFKYLKYSDSSGNQTLLFFLNPDSVCKSIRIICDAGTKDDKVREFNSIYEKNGENRWKEKRDGKDYMIEIKDEKWSSIITIEPYK